LTLHESEDESEGRTFASLVYISFSVFDDFTLPPPRTAKLRAAQVSLRGEKSAKVADTAGKPTRAGRELFVGSLAICRRGSRRERWRDAIKALESDPLFEEADFNALLDEMEEEWREIAGAWFEKLSSGHAVVLLTITKLVELVDETTLVVMDEPEGHLHPPLLSALIRSLSDLLIKRNGVAIIATHSPVILQEVPASCVWKLERTGVITVAERPRIETFGENVGTLTSEVFKLEVTAAGYHKLLTDEVEARRGDYEAILKRFGNQLGAEAKAIVRGLASIYRAKEGEL
jgi:ATPase subunit of ABC transporter with duplicated ATPase domains